MCLLFVHFWWFLFVLFVVVFFVVVVLGEGGAFGAAGCAYCRNFINILISGTVNVYNFSVLNILRKYLALWLDMPFGLSVYLFFLPSFSRFPHPPGEAAKAESSYNLCSCLEVKPQNFIFFPPFLKN